MKKWTYTTLKNNSSIITDDKTFDWEPKQNQKSY